MKTIHLTFQHPPDTWDNFLGTKLDEDSYDLLVKEDADVYTPEGEILFKFRKKCLNPEAAQAAFPTLLGIKEASKNRGVANGNLFLEKMKEPLYKKDGTLSKNKLNHGDKNFDLGSSVVIGFYDRYVRRPYCRETAFNAKDKIGWNKVLPFLQSCSDEYQKAAPESFQKQKAVADRTHPDWIIPKTNFTTITVNQNWSTACHKDVGDLKDGLSCITALRAGKYTGANLVFPHYRAAVNLDTLDLLMFNSHHIHGNTPLIGKVGGYKRVSLVLYFRENMVKCKSAAEELEIAKNRKPGDALWGE